ncbi:MULTISPECIES: hypothetical protein [unclassified Kribbella]|uniref:hypothetical protein n=1 Tax=unclassified Kribbella TaxID=2644121 RepID=UPI0030771B74
MSVSAVLSASGQVDECAGLELFDRDVLRATGSVTYSVRQSGTTFIINLNVDGKPATVAISGGGSLYRAG